MVATVVVPSFCRNCTGYCPVLVTVEGGRPVKVTGDPQAIEYEGYLCPKGRALAEQHNAPMRLLNSQARRQDGSFDAIPALQAVDEIAERLQEIISSYGPNSVAFYQGNGILAEFFSALMGIAFMRAIKSDMIFSAATIDKPAEPISHALHGNWSAGAHSFHTSDVWMLIGANPVISKSKGVPPNNPGMRLKQAVKNGLKLLVIDPRRTETARRAHIHLQALPGEDPTILAGIIQIVIAEKLYDRAFLDENVEGLAALEAAVQRFVPEYVAARAGVRAEDLVETARVFAKAKRGCAVCATGPSFSTRGNLAFYLALSLNTLCGRWTRAGEEAPMPNVLLPAYTPRAQPQKPYEIFGARRLIGTGLRQNASGMPVAGLPDEMLLKGEGRIRALLSVGGNPMSAWPDERKTEQALRSLDLLVQFDAQMSATAKIADYVIATPMQLEVPGATYLGEALKYEHPNRGYEFPWAQYTPAICRRPAHSDLIETHEVFFRIAQKMGVQVEWTNAYGRGTFTENPPDITPFDMRHIPTLDDLWELTTRRSRVSLSEVKRHPHGKTFHMPLTVAPREEGCRDRLQIGDPQMMAELAEIYADKWQSPGHGDQFFYRLVSRRVNKTMNSMLVDYDGSSRGQACNPIFVHSLDIVALGLKPGDFVSVQSRSGTVLTMIQADDTLRRGVVSLTHGFGGDPSDPDGGANVNMLISHDERDLITGIPRMSSVPVAILPAPLTPESAPS